jgi:hypothetical protein
MDFRLYYSNHIDSFANGNFPALAAAPAIVNILATPSGGKVNLKVNVVGDPAAGIQEVWVTYTATKGHFAGKWQSLDLTQNKEDSTLWEGVLHLDGTAAQDIRFMVQAANGVGLVSLATNLGTYYIPGFDPTSAQPTSLSLDTPQATSGPYGATAKFSAVLIGNSGPLSGRLVTIGLGPLSQQAVTDSHGRATVTIPLLVLPDQYKVTASFAGTTTDAPSSAGNTFDFQINKQNTTLTLDPQAATGHADDDRLMVALLRDTAGRRLREQAVFFVVSGSGGTFSGPAITDYTGQATLGNVPLPPGNYEVKAFFGDTISLPGTGDLVLENDLYHPSMASGTLTLLSDICSNILDDFNRPKPQLSDSWTGSRSPKNYRIVNGQVEVLEGGPIYWKNPAFGADQEACITLVKIVEKGDYRLLLKVQERDWAKGAIAVFYDPSKKQVGVKTFVPKQGGVKTFIHKPEWKILATFPVTLKNGDQLGGQALADGTVRIFVNGQQVGETNAGSFFVNRGGYLGLWMTSPDHKHALLDDFSGK